MKVTDVDHMLTPPAELQIPKNIPDKEFSLFFRIL